MPYDQMIDIEEGHLSLLDVKQKSTKNSFHASSSFLYSENGFTDNDSVSNENPLNLVLEEEGYLEYILVISCAAALSFNSGFVNGCTLQYRNIPVSHITGSFSHAALGLGEGKYENLLINMSLVLCFILGSAITGSMIPNEQFKGGLEYARLFYIGATFFLLACYLATYYPESDWYFFCAAIASGIQNAISLKYNGSIIRTSHITGAGTDIGLVIGRVITGNHKELWKLQLLLPIVISFFFGGVVSVFAFESFGKMSLLVNFAVFFIIGTICWLMITKELHISIWNSLLRMILYQRYPVPDSPGNSTIPHPYEIAVSSAKQSPHPLSSVATPSSATSSSATTTTKTGERYYYQYREDEKEMKN